ncbi:choice-of-anchor J domain-containing protein [Aridibaculum aurantiacum]|uniref:choice-of-anchor J domain-containing protein n=1 Tax=Aridibaculum aurantiacum TaxID=2810307 RepID=UPI001A967EA2|nr:choice-of-anchor J domain-containing protein [Aridibaculum aurantiacum]
MKTSKPLIYAIASLVSITMVVASCKKETAPTTRNLTPVFPPATSASFVEEFDTVGNLAAKGWIFRNNSSPIGQTGWRQGRYEAATGVQFKFLAPVPYIGFPAYSASKTPNDFVSCDASAANDISGNANISAWLISPVLPMKNGDQIIFYTRAVNDQDYSVYTRDRMQVRANFTDGSANVGNTHTSTGSFSVNLLDINSNYLNNDATGNTPAVPGYPQQWTKYTITLAGVPGGAVTNGRFAFRYMSTDAGLFGGTSGDNYPSVVGVDSLAFVRQ